MKELANVVKTMKKSSTIDFLVGEMNSAVQEFQNDLKYFPTFSVPQSLPEAGNAQNKKTEPNSKIADSVPLMDIVPIVTLASLLIEIASRIEVVVEAVEELADLAQFKHVADDKTEEHQPTNKVVPEQHIDEETMVTLQRVWELYNLLSWQCFIVKGRVKNYEAAVKNL